MNGNESIMNANEHYNDEMQMNSIMNANEPIMNVCFLYDNG